MVPDAIVVDGADESAMQIAARSEPGGEVYVVGSAMPSGAMVLDDGNVVASDMVLAGGALHLAYAYTGSEKTAGVWYLIHNTE